jgi:hypothetical protein
MQMRKQTTDNPEAMPIRTASNRKNCSSRRLKRCGESMVRSAVQYCRRVGVETAGFSGLPSLGLAIVSCGLTFEPRSRTAPASAELGPSGSFANTQERLRAQPQTHIAWSIRGHRNLLASSFR